jgi:hypothetical protein
MRVLLAATIAASVLAIGSGLEPAASLPLGGSGDPGAAIHEVQQMSPGPRTDRGKARSGERGLREDSPRMGQRPRGYRDGGREGRRFEADREWRGYGRRGFDARPGYGFRASCGWLRRRALDTGSRYWWRRYRECVR